jgi:hypothetical protein
MIEVQMENQLFQVDSNDEKFVFSAGACITTIHLSNF